MAQVCGEINYQIMDNKNLMMQILEKYQTIHDLKASKINVEEYRDLQKKFEKDQWLKSIDDHLKTSNTFRLPRKVSYDSYFKGNNNNYIHAIIMPNKSINKWMNVIKLELTNYWNSTPFFEEKSYIKKEKIIEILEQNDWTIESETLKTVKS